VSDSSIAYDQRLEEEFEKIKFKIWMNEEVQIQPKEIAQSIFKSYSKFNS
jgi:hypothetical protein